jgi:hypothetical protein
LSGVRGVGPFLQDNFDFDLAITQFAANIGGGY